MISTFLTAKLDRDEQKKVIFKKKNGCVKHNRRVVKTPAISMLSLAALLVALTLSGCQPPSESMDDSQTSAQTDEMSKPGIQSDSAAARIKEFELLYATKMQELQQRLQAEYEALQAADTSDNDYISPLGVTSEPINSETDNTTAATTGTGVGNERNISTEVGERDLEVLKLIRIEPREPSILTENQLIERYQQALQALYEPASIPLSAQDIDTLINIMTLLPELFEHAEIANRVGIKSPALARLITQHQVWQQIEVQQALDMEQMKLTQQEEFEELMAKFNDTIAGYDEQIAKYEQTLEEFQ